MPLLWRKSRGKGKNISYRDGLYECMLGTMKNKRKTSKGNKQKRRTPAPKRAGADKPFTRTAFLMLAILIMILLDQLVFSGDRPYIEAVKKEGLFVQEKDRERLPPPESLFETSPLIPVHPVVEITKQTARKSASDNKHEDNQEGKKAETNNGRKDIISGLIAEDTVPDTGISVILPKKGIQVHEIDLPENRPVWKKNAVRSYPPEGWPRIAIIIDDMGVDQKRSKQVIALKGPLTLAFLPYARKVDRFARAGRTYGHELMIHMPMEAMNGDLDLGGIYLDSSMSPSETDEMLDRAFSSFGGYVGINNHMGSRLTQNHDYMNMVMKRLENRGLIFVDSRTINSSIATEVARDYNVPYAVRDVFLDHEATPEFVRKSLEKLEYIARYNGHAIAIGHPKDATIQVLKEWLPTLKEKKIALVPVSMIVKEEEINRLSSSLLDAPAQNRVSPR